MLRLQGGFGEEMRTTFASWSLRSPGERVAAQSRKPLPPPHVSLKLSPGAQKKIQALSWRAEQWGWAQRLGKGALSEGTGAWPAGNSSDLDSAPPEIAEDEVLVSGKLLDPVMNCRSVWQAAGGWSPGALWALGSLARSAQPWVLCLWRRSSLGQECPRRPQATRELSKRHQGAPEAPHHPDATGRCVPPPREAFAPRPEAAWTSWPAPCSPRLRDACRPVGESDRGDRAWGWGG